MSERLPKGDPETFFLELQVLVNRGQVFDNTSLVTDMNTFNLIPHSKSFRLFPSGEFQIVMSSLDELRLGLRPTNRKSYQNNRLVEVENFASGCCFVNVLGRAFALTFNDVAQACRGSSVLRTFKDAALTFNDVQVWLGSFLGTLLKAAMKVKGQCAMKAKGKSARLLTKREQQQNLSNDEYNLWRIARASHGLGLLKSVKKEVKSGSLWAGVLRSWDKNSKVFCVTTAENLRKEAGPNGDNWKQILREATVREKRSAGVKRLRLSILECIEDGDAHGSDPFRTWVTGPGDKNMEDARIVASTLSWQALREHCEVESQRLHMLNADH